jgi:hypothetical protein
MAFCKDCVVAHGELLAARGTLFQTVALNAFWVLLGWLGKHAFQHIDVIAVATERATRFIAPKHGLKAWPQRAQRQRLRCAYMVWTVQTLGFP